MNVGTGSFLVAVEVGSYVLRFDDSKPICCVIPSFAEHFDYALADRIAVNLRSRGYAKAHVCGLKGVPATPQSIVDGEAAADHFAVIFNTNYYFAGRDRKGSPLGSRDKANMARLTLEVAEEIVSRLQQMKFKDARVVDLFEVVGIENELKAAWGTQPESVESAFKEV